MFLRKIFNTNILVFILIIIGVLNSFFLFKIYKKVNYVESGVNTVEIEVSETKDMLNSMDLKIKDLYSEYEAKQQTEQLMNKWGIHNYN